MPPSAMGEISMNLATDTKLDLSGRHRKGRASGKQDTYNSSTPHITADQNGQMSQRKLAGAPSYAQYEVMDHK